MQSAPKHPRENERIEQLQALHILDTDGEAAYDELTRLVTLVLGTEIALVSLVDQERQWFKSRCGIDARQTSRDIAFCAHAIVEPDSLFVVENALDDVRFADNPLVTSGPEIRFYAGMPIKAPDTDLPVGTVCAISAQPKSLTDMQREQLTLIARQVERLLVMRRYQMQLISARELAERANRSKTRFLATISHDMRTPLHGLLGTVDLLLEREHLADVAEQLEVARVCGMTLRTLVDETLDLSKLESGAVELRADDFTPKHLIANVATVVRAVLRPGVRLEIEGVDDLPMWLRGDASRCQQIVLNLANNAAKFTLAGNVSIRSGYRNCIWSIEVADTGVGIPPEKLDQVFEPFWQSEEGRRIDNSGVGLGLSICKRLIDAMGGSIDVTSNMGEGSCFKVHLPLAKATANAHATPGVATITPGLRVLLAEDDAFSRLIAAAHLKKLGCVVEAVADGAVALARLMAEPWDMAVLDFHMPSLSGPRIIEQYREQERGARHLPILVLTASNFADEQALCLRAGADRLMTKPFQRPELVAAIAALAASSAPEKNASGQWPR
jgi:signal transduction histidine kinase/ActR/RegA family two-component response regulator